MGWDGSGNFTRTNGVNTGSTTWTKDKNASTKITSARHDTHDQDLADGIDNCLTKDGQNAATGDIDMGGFLIRNHGATGKNLPIMDAGDDLPTITGGSFTYNEQRTEYVRTGKVINFVVVIKGFYAATATGTNFGVMQNEIGADKSAFGTNISEKALIQRMDFMMQAMQQQQMEFN